MKKNFFLCLWSVAVLGAVNVAVANEIENGEGDDTSSRNVYRVGGSFSDDSAYALNASADWSVTDTGRVQLGGAYGRAKQRSGQQAGDVNSSQANIEWDQKIGSWGVALGGEYWGDGSNINSRTVRGRGYYEGKHTHIGVVFERRRTEISYDLSALLSQYIPDTRNVNSNDYGLDLRFNADKLSIYGDARYYSYDEPINLLFSRFDLSNVPLALRPAAQLRIDALSQRINRINATSLRLSNNLLDYSLVLGADYRVGEHTLNLELSRERAAVDGAIIDSQSVGWIIPMGLASDVELRAGRTHIDVSGSTFYGALTFSFYR